MPQVWRLRVALLDQAGQITVSDVALNDGSASFDVDFSKLKAVVLFVIGLTRFTTVPAPYQVEVAAR